MLTRPLLCLALLTMPLAATSPAIGQANDAAYCADLAAMARRYLGQSAAGRNIADLDTAVAADQCQRGDTAGGIATLERKLRNNGFTLPKR